MASKLKKAPKSSKVANTELAKADAERAFSGAWGTHNDGRYRRARTRLARDKKAIQDQL